LTDADRDRNARRDTDPNADPDAALLAGVAQADAAAVRALVARKLPRLLALATRMLGDRMEAEDVAQEAFVRIWKHAPRWRAGEARFDTWLHRVALNLCYDRLRASRDEPVDELPDSIDPAAPPDARLEAHARDANVRAALAALPARQREAIVLQYYQELSNLEAAAVMGITVDALESLLSRARRNLRASLATVPDTEPAPRLTSPSASQSAAELPPDARRASPAQPATPDSQNTRTRTSDDT
jgi:RNA polymerase sigma factor (sigma-70 family)